jgi:hypothetical protein
MAWSAKARRIAANIAKLPELLRQRSRRPHEIAPCCIWAKNCRSCDIYSRHEIETMAGFVFAGLGAFHIVH